MAKPDITPLLGLLRACESEAERAAFAAAAGTDVNYLYALAGCHRQQPKAALAVAIEDASRAFNKTTKGRIPIVTVRELASMCMVAGLKSA